MIKPIILVMSCARDRANGRQQAAEETWMRSWGWIVPHRFVLGRDCAGIGLPWELIVPAPDDYNGVVDKFQMARGWALTGGYTHIFHACIDTWINVPKLMVSDFEKHDYTGYRCDEGHGSGGMGYWLSAKAARAVMVAQAPPGVYEDLWVGAVLRDAGIPLFEDRRYSSPANPNRPPDEITLHLSRGTDNYDPTWMRVVHQQFKDTGHV